MSRNWVASSSMAVLLAVSSFAQDPRGKVVGRVVDATGAVIPGAEVRIANENTGVAAAARTTASGDFVLPYLIAGTYTLSCQTTGFKKWVRPGTAWK